jgi:hypothetical protein
MPAHDLSGKLAATTHIVVGWPRIMQLEEHQRHQLCDQLLR